MKRLISTGIIAISSVFAIALSKDNFLARFPGDEIKESVAITSTANAAEQELKAGMIDPKSGKTIPPGAEGELVLTTLSKEAFPLIRFRTGDVASMNTEVCACGRTHCRISRINKRCDGIIVMKGTSINPEHIGHILAKVNDDHPKYQIIVDQQGGQDQLTVLVEISDTIFFDEMKKQRGLVDTFHQAVSEFLGWEVKITLVEPGSLDSDNQVLDKRKFQ